MRLAGAIDGRVGGAPGRKLVVGSC